MSSVEEVRNSCIAVNRQNVIYASPDAIAQERSVREPLFREILSTSAERHGDHSHEASVARYFLALSLTRSEEFAEAEQLLRRCLSDFEAAGEIGTTDYVWVLNRLIDTGFESNNLELVEEVFSTYAAQSKRWPSSSFSDLYFFWFRYYEFLMERDEIDKAADAYTRVYENAARVWGDGHEQHFIAVAVYADLLFALEEFDRAREIALEALEIGRNSSEVSPDLVRELESQLGL